MKHFYCLLLPEPGFPTQVVKGNSRGRGTNLLFSHIFFPKTALKKKKMDQERVHP